jgi:quercetin dioxygenase-like cupin family protein
MRWPTAIVTQVDPQDLAVAAAARGERPEAPLLDALDPDAQEVLILAALWGPPDLVLDLVGPDFRCTSGWRSGWGKPAFQSAAPVSTGTRGACGCQTSGVVPEAPLRMSRNGLVTDGEGWFVVNARESRWRETGPLGAFCTFEGKRRFPHFGINVSVLEPGEAMAMYHRENAQEAFLVLSGTCTLVVEGEERLLTAWDFFHCPPGTEHVIVATGEESAVVVAVGARGRGRGATLSPMCEAAARYGASVERETTKSAEAYAGFPKWKWAPYTDEWLPDMLVPGPEAAR